MAKQQVRGLVDPTADKHAYTACTGVTPLVSGLHARFEVSQSGIFLENFFVLR